ncbi:MAG: TldD/PmbA family protein [Syntrophobacterales bacterium]|nr:MAG: TldD/PmbA family protein [Syntrophobacterales bacterium]
MFDDRFNPREIAAECVQGIKKRRVDGYEIYLSQSVSTSIEVRDGELESFKKAQSMGLGLRIIKGQRLGFSYCTSFDAVEIARMIEAAIDGAANLSADPFYGFPAPPRDFNPIPGIYDGRIRRISAQERIEKAMALEAMALASDPKRVKRVGKAIYEDAERMVFLVNSEGVEEGFTSSIFMGSVMAVAEEGSESEMGWDFDFHHSFEGLDVARIGREAARKAREKLGARPLKTAFYPTLIRNQIACEFLSILAPSFAVENVRKGKSLFSDGLGSRAFSSKLNIYDDGLHPQGMVTSPFDGEGVESQRTPVVISGRITGFLFDFYWASREEGRSTGNCIREGIKVPPSLGISNLYIERGDRSFSDLLGGLQNGIVIEEVMGIHTANPISGDFSLGAAGSWIESGRPIHPVKGIAISGNVLDLFKNIEEVGSDFRFTGKLGSPSLRTSKLAISGR